MADSESELNKLTKILETVMATKLFYIKIATFQQLEGLQTILPRAENHLNQNRNLDSSSAALTFPFVSSELVQESGILYGINKSNNSLGWLGTRYFLFKNGVSSKYSKCFASFFPDKRLCYSSFFHFFLWNTK